MRDGNYHSHWQRGDERGKGVVKKNDSSERNLISLREKLLFTFVNVGRSNFKNSFASRTEVEKMKNLRWLHPRISKMVKVP